MSKIEWTTTTWNPIVGCSIPTNPGTGKAREGCRNCYACKDSPHRFPDVYGRDGVVVLRGKAMKPGLTWVPSARVSADQRKGRPVLERHDDGTITVSLGKGAQWTGEVRLLPWVLEKPLKRKKPTTYFVNSLSDLFHESLVDCEEGRHYIAAIFGVMAASPQHTFQVLTKRPHKAREWFAWARGRAEHWGTMRDVIIDPLRCTAWGASMAAYFDGWEEDIRVREPEWPLPNVQLGTSVEDQASADWAIPELLQVPAAMRWISAEPLLGPLDFRCAPGGGQGMLADECGTAAGNCGDNSCRAQVSWVVVGGESGPGARPCEVAWIRSVVEQCKAAEVPVFCKQLGARPLARSEADLSEEQIRIWDAMDDPPRLAEGYFPRLDSAKGGDPSEWPEDLRVREMP